MEQQEQNPCIFNYRVPSLPGCSMLFYLTVETKVETILETKTGTFSEKEPSVTI